MLRHLCGLVVFAAGPLPGLFSLPLLSILSSGPLAGLTAQPTGPFGSFSSLTASPTDPFGPFSSLTASPTSPPVRDGRCVVVCECPVVLVLVVLVVLVVARSPLQNDITFIKIKFPGMAGTFSGCVFTAQVVRGVPGPETTNS